MASRNCIYSLLFVIISVYFSDATLYTVILPPINGSIEAALIIIPSENISGESYRSLGVSIQKASPLKLWIGLTCGYPVNETNTADVRNAIDDAIGELHSDGLSAVALIFVAVHSQGRGVVTQEVVDSEPNKFGGMLLWASYLRHTANLTSFPRPVLHLSGELDGVTRITRISSTFRELTSLNVTNPTAEYSKPVVLLQGVNHGHFASQPLPPTIVNNDIPSNLSFSEAHTLIANVCSLFMTVNMKDYPASNARMALHDQVSRTNQTLTPLFAAEDYQMKGNNCKWAVTAQEMVANVPNSYKSILNVTSKVFSDQSKFEASKPSVTKGSDGNVHVTTMAKIYLPSNPNDVPAVEQSAVEIAVKTKNQKAVKKILGNGSYGTQSSCSDINQSALKWALQTSSPEVQSRYHNTGRHMLFGEDHKAFTGSEWVGAPLHYKYTSDGNLMVTSTSLYTDPNFIIPSLAGMYYCKLLSPYRAMEWIYVDSLKPYNP